MLLTKPEQVSDDGACVADYADSATQASWALSRESAHPDGDPDPAVAPGYWRARADLSPGDAARSAVRTTLPLLAPSYTLNGRGRITRARLALGWFVAGPPRSQSGSDTVASSGGLRWPRQTPVTVRRWVTMPCMPFWMPVPVPVALMCLKAPVPPVQLTFWWNVPIVRLVNL
jgi:hypothetical protein